MSIIREWIKKYKCNKKTLKLKEKISIDDSVVLLPSTKVEYRGCKNVKRVRIGAESMVGCNFIFERDSGYVNVGKRTFINGGTNIISINSIDIGDDVTIGWGCYIYDHNSHSVEYKFRQKDIFLQRQDYLAGRDFIHSKDWAVVKSAPIKICDKVWIGFNCIILKGCTIGEGAIVAAGSVVTGDIPSWSIAGGNPARIIKKIR